jgi:8-oxo-dGTP diphosphatase
VNENEDAAEAAQRELEEETCVKNIFLKQLKTYTDPLRDPRGRVISIAYMALISPDQHLHAATDAMVAEWHRVDALPALAFDHKMIVADALRQLRIDIQTTNIAYQILPRKFTLTELQRLYEVVLDKKLDKRNFRKRIKELAILKETNETKMEGAHRPARLYEFRSKKYMNLKERIHVFLK